MALMAIPELYRRPNLYANSAQIAIDAAPFDGGQDGSVWYTDRQSVIKVFERQDSFEKELECYLRLKEAGVGSKIREFNVPALVEFSRELSIIEMGVVFPPYILDFGKAHLKDPLWDRDIIDEWNERMDDWWGDDVKRVRLALAALRGLGIWYYDAKPGNVMLESWKPRLGD
jgi:hypothetical protein